MNKFEKKTQFIIDIWYQGLSVSHNRNQVSIQFALAGMFTDSTVEETILSVLTERVAGKEGCALLKQSLKDMVRKAAEEIASEQLGWAYVDDCRKHYLESEK